MGKPIPRSLYVGAIIFLNGDMERPFKVTRHRHADKSITMWDVKNDCPTWERFDALPLYSFEDGAQVFFCPRTNSI